MLHCVLYSLRFVGRFMSRKERLEMLGDKAKKYTNVYIKNFGDQMTDEKLSAMFEPFGKIISAKVGCPTTGFSCRILLSFSCFFPPNSSLGSTIFLYSRFTYQTLHSVVLLLLVASPSRVDNGNHNFISRLTGEQCDSQAW